MAVKPATRTHAQRLAGHLPADFGKRKTGPGTHGGCEENGVQVLEDTEEVDENKSNVLTQQKDEITRSVLVVFCREEHINYFKCYVFELVCKKGARR